MGPIELQQREHYRVIHSRLKNTKHNQVIDYTRIIADLQKENAELKAQLSEARLDSIRRKPSNGLRNQVIHKIITMVSEKERISKDDLIGACRQSEVCFGRQICFFLACTYTNFTTSVIGYHFGKRDHATVIHGRDKIQLMRVENQALHSRLLYYEKELSSGTAI